MFKLVTNAASLRGKLQGLFSSSLEFGRHLNPPIALATVELYPSPMPAQENKASESSIADCLWLAVPKSKITRSKKRMKTTTQKRISKKENIVVDGRTGEITLRHKLPFNWKDYLPESQ